MKLVNYHKKLERF